MKTPFPAMKCLQKVLKSQIKKCLRHRVKVNRKNFDRGETGTVNDPDIYFKGQKKGFGTNLYRSSAAALNLRIQLISLIHNEFFFIQISSETLKSLDLAALVGGAVTSTWM